MQSMTGYGKAHFSDETRDLLIEIKTVNNRFIDYNLKYPRSLSKYEDLMRKVISDYISRGRIELNVTLRMSGAKARPVVVDIPLAESYVNAYETLKKEFPAIRDDFTLVSVMKCPDVVCQQIGDDDDEIKDILIETLKSALVNLNSMRHTEGEKLKTDLLSRVLTIEAIVFDIEKRAPLVQTEYGLKLKKRIEEALNGVGVDETRLLQEIALFADKSNIDEEITRLKSHISQFRKIVESDNSGKKLDFLVQEFNREANTICSKANDVYITDCGLRLKCEIEKIREQIQNVE